MAGIGGAVGAGGDGGYVGGWVDGEDYVLLFLWRCAVLGEDLGVLGGELLSAFSFGVLVGYRLRSIGVEGRKLGSDGQGEDLREARWFKRF